MLGRTVTIQKGTIIVYRVFDVAEEIDLSKVEALASGKMLSERLHIRKMPRPALIIRNAPLSFTVRETQFTFSEVPVKAETTVKFWDYGAMAISFNIPLKEGTEWSDLETLARDIENSKDIDSQAIKIANELLELFKSAMKAPALWDVFEDYSIYFLQKVDGVSQPRELLKKCNVAALLLVEAAHDIAEVAQASILDETYQYRENDIAVIDWNSALVVEPSGSREIPDVIEFALTHLLESRFYDDLLDRRLGELYDQIEKAKKNITSNKFSKIMEESSTLYIEFSELIERVENSLKVVGDFYLARIFRAATRRFRVNDWEGSITRKMNLLAQVSNLLQGELNVRRSHWLEVIVVLLIAFEILMAFYHK